MNDYENEYEFEGEYRDELKATYPCPDIECDGIVEYEASGYWQCSECSFRAKHINIGYVRRTPTGWLI